MDGETVDLLWDMLPAGLQLACRDKRRLEGELNELARQGLVGSTVEPHPHTAGQRAVWWSLFREV